MVVPRLVPIGTLRWLSSFQEEKRPASRRRTSGKKGIHPQGMLKEAAIVRAMLMEVLVNPTSYWSETRPLIRLHLPVATNSARRLMSRASCSAASIW